MFLDDRLHETERQFLLVGIGCLLGLRIIEIDGVDVPIEHPQKLHHRLAAADGGGIFGAVGQQVAEIQEPPDILFARLRGDMRAHVKKETGPGSPQGAEGVGKHIVRYAEKPDPEIVAYLLDGSQLPGKQSKHHSAHDPETVAENLYRSRTRQADASDPLHKVYRTTGYRQFVKLCIDTELPRLKRPEKSRIVFIYIHYYKIRYLSVLKTPRSSPITCKNCRT